MRGKLYTSLKHLHTSDVISAGTGFYAHASFINPKNFGLYVKSLFFSFLFFPLFIIGWNSGLSQEFKVPLGSVSLSR